MITALLFALTAVTTTPARPLPFLPPEPLRVPAPQLRAVVLFPSRRRGDRSTPARFR